MRIAAAVAALALLASSCSLTMETVPDDWDPSRDVECDSSRTNPIGETVSAVVFGGLTVFLLAERSDCTTDHCRDTAGLFALSTGVFTALSAITAKVGYGRAADCRDAKRKRHEWRAAHSGPPGLQQ